MHLFRLNTTRENSKSFYVIHEDTCPLFHQLKHYIDLGEFMFCSTAMQRARALGYTHVDGCSECCKPCHWRYN